MKDTILITCPLCGNSKIKARDTVIVHNTDTEQFHLTWTHCKKRGTSTLTDLDLAQKIHDKGAGWLSTSLPKFSKRPWGPALDEMDLSLFVKNLSQYNHLAEMAS